MSINCVQLLWQRGLTLAPTFVACDILNRLPHIFTAVGFVVPLQSLLMSHLFLLVVSFQSFCGGLVCFLVTRPKRNFVGSVKSPPLSIHQEALGWLGNDLPVFVIRT